MRDEMCPWIVNSCSSIILMLIFYGDVVFTHCAFHNGGRGGEQILFYLDVRGRGLVSLIVVFEGLIKINFIAPPLSIIGKCPYFQYILISII